MLDDKQKPQCYSTGVFYSFWHGGLNHRLVTDYLSLSSHLQMRWLITLATTAIIKDRSKSLSDTPFPYQLRRRNGRHYNRRPLLQQWPPICYTPSHKIMVINDSLTILKNDTDTSPYLHLPRIFLKHI